MTWVTTTDVDRFLAEAGPFLASDPVANNVLLTEASFCSWLPDPVPGARFGWWVEGDLVRGAFIDLPDHATVCSPLSAASVADLPGVLENATHLGVPEGDVAGLTAAWNVRGADLRATARITLLRLEALRAREQPPGAPRVADADDRPLLRSWFEVFQGRHPDDPSHVGFVVDHPLENHDIVVWEVSGRPAAMASRTPEVAGMTRMGLAFQPTEGTLYADAAFDACCSAAARTTEHVLVLAGTPEVAAAYARLGFTHVLDRVVFHVLHSPA
jgi:hypothetical protein